MRVMLDTDTCIYIIKRSPFHVRERFKGLHPGDVTISAISYCELQSGVACSSRPTLNQAALTRFLAPLDILDFPAAASAVFGSIRAHLRRKGTPIGNDDLLIAAHALHEGITLITNNEREFRRVPDLRVENWV